jgi:hypothetical protein
MAFSVERAPPAHMAGRAGDPKAAATYGGVTRRTGEGGSRMVRDIREGPAEEYWDRLRQMMGPDGPFTYWSLGRAFNQAQGPRVTAPRHAQRHRRDHGRVGRDRRCGDRRLVRSRGGPHARHVRAHLPSPLSLGGTAPGPDPRRERSPFGGTLGMGDTKAVDAVRSAVAALNDGDIDGYLGYFDPSCQRWIGGLAQSLALTDIGDNLHQLHAAFEGLHLDEDLLFGDERFVCARWRLRGLHVNDYLGFTPKRRSIDVATCEIYEISGDRVVTAWVYGDLEQLFQQIAAEDGDVT